MQLRLHCDCSAAALHSFTPEWPAPANVQAFRVDSLASAERSPHCDAKELRSAAKSIGIRRTFCGFVDI
jgi:hypothetical protein